MDGGKRLRTTACLLVAIASVTLAGCRGELPSTQVAAKDDRALVIVTPYMAERALAPINQAFLAEHPEAKIEFKAAMINEMVDAMETEGGSGDVLVMMDGPEMKILEQAGVVDARRKRVWGTCPVVLVASEGNPKRVHTIRDLTREDLAKVAIPDPDRDSTGAAFRQAAMGAGVWEAIQGKLLIEASPHEACTLCENAGADVAVTYSPCVLSGHSESTLCLAAFLPDELDEPVAMAAAPFVAAAHPLTEAYLDHLVAPASQIIVGRAGFVPVKGPSPAEARSVLFVPCGAGLQPAMDDIGSVHFQRTGTRVDFSYAGAGMLLSVLMTTRRGDLCIPGEAYYVDQAAKHGFIAEDEPICYMTPVLGVREGNPKHVAGIMDLTRPDLRVAIGDPEAIAIGPMTERILQRAGIFEQVERNLHMKAACVPELANALATHSADVGVIWDVMAFQNQQHLDSLPIDPRYNEASEVLVSRLTCSSQPEEARKLMAFLTSEEAAAIFHRHGYATEPPAGVRLAPREKVGRKACK